MVGGTIARIDHDDAMIRSLPKSDTEFTRSVPQRIKYMAWYLNEAREKYAVVATVAPRTGMAAPEYVVCFPGAKSCKGGIYPNTRSASMA